MDFDRPKVYGDTSITDGLVSEDIDCLFTTKNKKMTDESTMRHSSMY